MPIKTVASFDIPYLQVLDHEGGLDRKLEPKLTVDQLKEMFRLMLLSRQFDDTCINMQREGRLGTYAPLRGQEASEVGSAFALGKQDLMFPSFREHAVFITRGTPIYKLLLSWMGHPEGGKIDPKSNNFPAAVPVGTHTLHAAGAGWGLELQKKKTAAIVYFGDGATSEGDFNEAINFAGAFNSHILFFCQNNQWAISVPRSRQTAAKTLAQKGIAGGLEVMQVDGNDILAVYKATKDALAKARQGKPVMIESVTFRMGPHTTADNPERYVSKKDLSYWEERDPIKRFREYLKTKKLWTKAWEDGIARKNESLLKAETKKAEAVPPPDFEDMFSNVFSEPLPNQDEQMKKRNTLP